MPGIPVTIIGELYDNRLTIGGGPIIPPPQQPQPPGIWPSPGYPAHPIAPGGPPPTVQHPIILPPNSIWPGVPAHPIVIIPPGSIWPGVPTHPIVLPLPPEAGGEPPSIWPSPGHPAHPIAPGGPPPSVWPGPGYPAHPIVLPPDRPTDPPIEPPTIPPDAGGNWQWGWNRESGWHPVFVPGDKPQPVPPPSGGGTPPVDPNAPTVNPLPA